MNSSCVGYVADFYQGSLQVGDEVPNFTCNSTLGAIQFHNAIDGQFSMLVTFPHNFDAIATTELGMIAKLKKEFDSRNVCVFALSVDDKVNHLRFIQEVETLQDCKITFPIICDTDTMISKTYGLTSAGEVIPAGLVLITDIDKRIKFVAQYPSTIGRNFYEILRVIDALQLTTFHKVSTPAHWKQGEDVFVRDDVTPVAAKSMFTKGFVAIREWFRLTPQPEDVE